MVDPNAVTSAVTVLTPLFGAHAAGVVSLAVAILWLLAQILPFLRVPSPASSAWYRIMFGLLARLTGSWGNASPMPQAGALPAGGIVPTPPALKNRTSPDE